MSLSQFLILSFLTVVVVLSIEDSTMHSILRHANQENILSGSKVKKVGFDELVDMGYEYATISELSAREGAFGEFPSGDKYYHFMILKDQALVLDSTDFIASETRIKGIIILLLKAFIPFLIVILLVSRMIAKRALLPFAKLKAIFLKPDKMAADIRKLNHQIEETDIKLIADELTSALDQKEQLLVQQIAFNQGMSHELRTPLQVMTHAVELIGLKHPELVNENVYGRLVSSMGRMHRTSEAMLWLTSTNESHHQLQVNDCMEKMKHDLLHAYGSHGLKLEVSEQAELSLAIPEEAFEFILHNLASNAVHHGLDDNGTKLLMIDIRSDAICFKNRVSTNKFESNSGPTNFGLGLSLVSRLCQRFGLLESIESNRGFYAIEISPG